LIIKTGTPPAVVPNTGTATITVKTNRGDIVVGVDLSKTPCTVEALRFLAGQNYFDSTGCHRLTTSGIYVVQCGDPTGSGAGGPQFTVPDEFGVRAPATISPGHSGRQMHSPPRASLTLAESHSQTAPRHSR
jgi:peptidyl-prolyl cis-trans isomerase B (cyclophilin B)